MHSWIFRLQTEVLETICYIENYSAFLFQKKNASIINIHAVPKRQNPSHTVTWWSYEHFFYPFTTAEAYGNGWTRLLLHCICTASTYTYETMVQNCVLPCKFIYTRRYTTITHDSTVNKVAKVLCMQIYFLKNTNDSQQMHVYLFTSIAFMFILHLQFTCIVPAAALQVRC